MTMSLLRSWRLNGLIFYKDAAPPELEKGRKSKRQEGPREIKTESTLVGLINGKDFFSVRNAFCLLTYRA
jgi:hypothetical protein